MMSLYRSYDEAESGYLSGKSLGELSSLLKLELSLLEEWRGRFLWDEKRIIYQSSGRGAAAIVRELMLRKVNGAQASQGVSMEMVDEIARISKSLRDLETDAVGTAGIMTVIRDLALWVRGRSRSPEEYHLVSLNLQGYLRECLGRER